MVRTLRIRTLSLQCHMFDLVHKWRQSLEFRYQGQLAHSILFGQQSLEIIRPQKASVKFTTTVLDKKVAPYVFR